MPSNELIVKVLGDTTGLTKGLRSAEQQINRFAGRSKVKSAGANALLGDIKGLQDQAAQLARTQASVDEAAARSEASLRRTGAASLIAGVAINTMGRNLAETSGETKRFGTALSALSTGNFVGFWKAARDNSEALDRFQKRMVETKDSSKVLAEAARFAAAGFDEIAKAARDAAKGMDEASVAARKLLVLSALSSGGIFGVTSLADPAIRAGWDKGKQRKGVGASQRNQWFDAGIGRQLDRVQDLTTIKSQVAALGAIGAQIQRRINATKDITRRLNLEDQLAGVNRQRQALIEQGAAAAAQAAKEAAARAAARTQARDFLGLGLQTPGAANLRKQLDQLSSRSDIGSIPNKLEAALEGARTILKRKWNTISEDSRSAIADLFDTIRGELNKGATGGPLTSTTQLNTERILAGLGLGKDAERAIRARLSHFNSAGAALVGAGSGSMTVTVPVVIDGKAVAHASSKYQRRARSVNPSQRNGPNPGRYD